MNDSHHTNSHGPSGQPSAIVVLENTASLAIVNLALGNLGLEIFVTRDRTQALKAADKGSCSIIVVSNDLKDVDPFSLARSLRDCRTQSIKGQKIQVDAKQEARRTAAEHLSANIPILLLLSSGSAQHYAEEARACGIDRILERPFRTDEVERVISELIVHKHSSETSTRVLEPKGLMMICDEPLLRSTALLALDRLKIDYVGCSNEHECLLASQGRCFVCTIVSSASVSSYDWYDNKTFGRLVILSKEKFPTSAPEAASILNRPVSQEMFISELNHCSQFEEAIRTHTLSPEKRLLRLSSGEQALLAARVSASVYEQLLTQTPLTCGKWEDAAELALGETMRICDEFQVLLDRKMKR